uniref:Putative secreted protein n=1 Tax=Anopheles darlingi TaxID=43151 RepID=A0A2M4DR81_ANODA
MSCSALSTTASSCSACCTTCCCCSVPVSDASMMTPIRATFSLPEDVRLLVIVSPADSMPLSHPEENGSVDRTTVVA